MPNRLANEDSPYLLQHQDDPVDWYAWGEEAFALAKRLDKPVFLSVGYSSCHWCHVMAHESFQDNEIAEALNRYFVSIKVDREERPDVDDAYMTAVQLATGHGGWPMSVFLTPDKKPFFAGTYFPKSAHGDFPGFRTLVTSLGLAWEQQRSEIEGSAEKFAETLSHYLTQSAGVVVPTLDVRLFDLAVEQLHEEFDFENGGFGTRPKFPPHATVRYLIDYAAKRHALGGDQDTVNALTEQAAHMALMTLERMALGGIHDHVGGGFHRYSTDEEWRLPHFEKMLTDNAQLLALYAMAAESSGDPALKELFTRTTKRIVDWMVGTLRTKDGMFMSAVDADSEGEEGVYYTWTSDEIAAALGERAETFAQAFGIEPDGNFQDEATRDLTGRNVLKLDQDVDDSFDKDLEALFTIRQNRQHPLIDAKCIASSNGLAIGALARAGRKDLAIACAERWLSLFTEDGLPHQVTNGNAKGLGFLDDYAYLADGLLDLFDETEDRRWRDAAQRLAGQMDQLFQSGDRYHATSEKHEQLFGRTVPALDQAVPSPLAIAARVHYRLGNADQARRTIIDSLGWMQRTTRATHSLLLLAFDDLVDDPDADRTIEPEQQNQIGISLEPREIIADKNGWAMTEVVMHIPTGMHVNSNDPTAKWLVPTSLRVEGLLGEASFPEGESYEGEVRIPVRLRAAKSTEEFQMTVRYQPCTESECLLPQEAVVSGVVIVP